MSESLTDVQAVEKGILESAVFLAKRIKNADGYAEAVENIVPFYLAKNEVDAAAALADAIDNSFLRDKLLCKIADKCAEIGDDDYALQLAEAIEDKISQEDVRERIAAHQAERFEFEKAFELAETVDHNSYALGEIAVQLAAGGETERALQIVEKIEYGSIKVNVLYRMALKLNENSETGKALELLEKAREETINIDVAEEKIIALLSIVFSYQEIKRKDKAIEVLAEAQNYAERLQGNHRNTLLSEISVGFLQAGSIDLADRTLDLVDDKTIIAATLTNYAEEYHKNDETAEAVEILEEAYALLKSQNSKDVRNSQEKFSTANSIAVQLASYGQPEKAIRVALENPSDDERFSALLRIARIYANEEKYNLAQQALEEINDEGKKLEAMIAVSDAKQKNGKTSETLDLLQKVYSQSDNIGQMSVKIPLFNELAARFYQIGETETARKILLENIANISKIYDESLKTTALAALGAAYEKLKIELTQQEKDALLSLLRQPARF